MSVKTYKRGYIHHSAERGWQSHRNTREITNYQKRDNIWESYFQLARVEEAEVREKTKLMWGAFFLTVSANVADLESRNRRQESTY